MDSYISLGNVFIYATGLYPLTRGLSLLLSYHSLQLLCDCVTNLRSYVPDSFALGSALFYLAIAQYYNTTPSMSTLSSDEIEETLESCLQHLTESISTPWTELSIKRKILCYLCRGKTYQRLRKYENSIEDLTYCIELYEGKDNNEGESENDDTSKDYDPSDAAYAYFRRGWSYKVGVSLRIT